MAVVAASSSALFGPAAAQDPGLPVSVNEEGLRLGTDGRSLSLLPYAQWDVGSVRDGGPRGTLRRATLTVLGEAGRLSGGYSVDFAPEAPDTVLGFVGYELAEGVTLRAGQLSQPLTLEQRTSSRFLVFAERGLNDTLASPIAAGVLLGAARGRWSLAAGAFGGDVNTGAGDGGTNLILHASFAPDLAPGPDGVPGAATHLGGSLAHQWLGPSDDPTSLLSRSSTSVQGSPSLPTPPVGGRRRVTRTNLEAARIWGPVSVQAEITTLTLVADEGAADGSAARTGTAVGGYAFVSWFPAGGRRDYAVGAADFDRPVPPARPGGAIEVAARIGRLDLEPLGGGTRTEVAGAVNWYATRELRLSFDAVAARRTNDRQASEHALLVRLQYAY